MPAPKVDSAVIKLNILSKPSVETDDEKLFFKVVKASFAQRRKTLANSLSSGLSLNKADVNAILERAEIPPAARAEEMTMEDFARITTQLSSLG